MSSAAECIGPDLAAAQHRMWLLKTRLHMEALSPRGRSSPYGHDNARDEGARLQGLPCERHAGTLILQDQRVIGGSEARVAQQLPHSPVLHTCPLHQPTQLRSGT